MRTLFEMDKKDYSGCTHNKMMFEREARVLELLQTEAHI